MLSTAVLDNNGSTWLNITNGYFPWTYCCNAPKSQKLNWPWKLLWFLNTKRKPKWSQHCASQYSSFYLNTLSHRHERSVFQGEGMFMFSACFKSWLFLVVSNYQIHSNRPWFAPLWEFVSMWKRGHLFPISGHSTLCTWFSWLQLTF